MEQIMPKEHKGGIIWII